MKYLNCILFSIVLISCQSEENKFVEFDFYLDTFDWDSNPYKFTSYIQDSVLATKGPQYAAWDFSYVGDIENTLKYWDGDNENIRELSQALKDSFATFEMTNAVDYILEKANEHRVLIINEAHHMPQHRVFTAQLLEGLNKLGYEHLGLETYFASAKNDSTLRATGYPNMRTGLYTKEPQFGNLVRIAHQNGFALFGYESRGHENSKGREINQAKNIKEYLERFPDEKVVIHCGFSHGYEGTLSNKWEKAMAGRLTEFTDLDPLTINQTIFSEKSKRVLENPYYQMVDMSESSVFVNKENKSFGEYRKGAWFDISVFHPRSGNSNRPKWLIYGNRKEVEYSFENANIESPCLVFAYKEGEKIGSAVPYDIQQSNNSKVNLVLDVGVFQIVILNEKGKAWKSTMVVGN